MEGSASASSPLTPRREGQNRLRFFSIERSRARPLVGAFINGGSLFVRAQSLVSGLASFLARGSFFRALLVPGDGIRHLGGRFLSFARLVLRRERFGVAEIDPPNAARSFVPQVDVHCRKLVGQCRGL